MGRRKTPNQRNRNFLESAKLNNITFQYYLDLLQQLAISRFEWKNLPKTVDERYLELTLFFDGFAVFFEDEVLGSLALKAMINGRYNLYDIPIRRIAYANNGYRRNLNSKNSVVLFNNMIHTPAYDTVLLFARRLANLDRIIDVNCNTQKTPVLIECDENERLTMQNAYQQFDGNAPVIYGKKGIKDGLTVLKTDAPYTADKLYELKSKIFNEALTYLGIVNVNENKRERMITDEVVRSMGGAMMMRESVLTARKQACEQINDMFGLNISVEFKDGGVNNVKLYSGGTQDMSVNRGTEQNSSV